MEIKKQWNTIYSNNIYQELATYDEILNCYTSDHQTCHIVRVSKQCDDVRLQIRETVLNDILSFGKSIRYSEKAYAHISTLFKDMMKWNKMFHQMETDSSQGDLYRLLMRNLVPQFDEESLLMDHGTLYIPFTEIDNKTHWDLVIDHRVISLKDEIVNLLDDMEGDGDPVNRILYALHEMVDCYHNIIVTFHDYHRQQFNKHLEDFDVEIEFLEINQLVSPLNRIIQDTHDLFIENLETLDLNPSVSNCLNRYISHLQHSALVKEVDIEIPFHWHQHFISIAFIQDCRSYMNMEGSKATWSFTDAATLMEDDWILYNFGSLETDIYQTSLLHAPSEESPHVMEAIFETHNVENYVIQIKSTSMLRQLRLKNSIPFESDVLESNYHRKNPEFFMDSVKRVEEDCDEGFYTFYNETSNERSCRLCEAGYFCPGDSIKYICNNGPYQDIIYTEQGVSSSTCPFLCIDERKYQNNNQCALIPLGMVYDRDLHLLKECETPMPSALYDFETSCASTLNYTSIAYSTESVDNQMGWESTLNVFNGEFLIGIRFKLKDVLNHDTLSLLSVEGQWSLNLDHSEGLVSMRFTRRHVRMNMPLEDVLISQPLRLETNVWYQLVVHGDQTNRIIITYINGISIASKWYDIHLVASPIPSRIGSSIRLGPSKRVEMTFMVDDLMVWNLDHPLQSIDHIFSTHTQFLNQGCNLDENDSVGGDCLLKCPAGYSYNPNGVCEHEDEDVVFNYQHIHSSDYPCGFDSYLLYEATYIHVKSISGDFNITSLTVYNEQREKVQITLPYPLYIPIHEMISVELPSKTQISSIHMGSIGDSKYDLVSIAISNEPLTSWNTSHMIAYAFKLVHQISSFHSVSILSPVAWPQMIFNELHATCHLCPHNDIFTLMHNNDILFCECLTEECSSEHLPNITFTNEPGRYYESVELLPNFPKDMEESVLIVYILSEKQSSSVHVFYPSSPSYALYTHTELAYFLLRKDGSKSSITKVTYRVFPVCPRPILYPASATFDDVLVLAIAHDPSVKVSVTIQGDVPLSPSYVYTEPIVISKTMQIQAFSFSPMDECQDSPIVSGEYIALKAPDRDKIINDGCNWACGLGISLIIVLVLLVAALVLYHYRRGISKRLWGTKQVQVT